MEKSQQSRSDQIVLPFLGGAASRWEGSLESQTFAIKKWIYFPLFFSLLSEASELSCLTADCLYARPGTEWEDADGVSEVTQDRICVWFFLRSNAFVLLSV